VSALGAGVPDGVVGRDPPDEARLGELAEEQAALRRVATLVARGTQPEEVFTAVAEEVGQLLPVDQAALCRYEPGGTLTFVSQWGSVTARFPVGSRWVLGGHNVGTLVFQTGRPARVDYDVKSSSGALGAGIREVGLRSAIGTPIIVEGRLWGTISVASLREQALPADTEARLVSFTELVATAIANTESRAAVTRLAEEQAALRRVATLVARGAMPEEVFAAVAEEVGQLLPADTAALCRYEPDGWLTFVAKWGGSPGRFPVGSRWMLGGHNLGTLVFQTGRPVRIDGYAESSSGEIGADIREADLRSGVATPVIVEGRLWGLIPVGSYREQLPLDTEARLISFTELVATAIANTESRASLARLAQEQAALRRVATLVALATPPPEVFAAVAEEAGQLLGVDSAILVRYDPQDMLEVVGTWIRTGAPAATPVGGRLPLGGRNVTTLVYQTGRPTRIDYGDDVSGVIGQVASQDWGLRSSVGVPVSVESRLWGCIVVAFSRPGLVPLPLDTEEHLASFTELVATAIANAESRSELAASRRRIVAAADEARRRIERDLHDGTQQRLVSLTLAARTAEADAAAGRGDLEAELSRLAGGLADAMTELQELSRGIHPAVLSERGLGPALRTLARRSAVPVDLDVTADARYPEPVEIAAYYIASEALANTMKHAQASHIEMSLAARDGHLQLSVRDDGVGGVDPARGSGLTGLADRVEALGGLIQVHSAAGTGTHIMVDLPLEYEPAASSEQRRNRRGDWDL
jgi:signal transduction histidine kinase